jgi:hypothetical protein
LKTNTLELAAKLLQDDPCLSVKHAATYLDVSPVALDHWRSRGIGPPYVRLHTGGIRYRLSDLNAFLIARAVQTTRIPAPTAGGPLTPRMKRDLALTRD